MTGRAARLIQSPRLDNLAEPRPKILAMVCLVSPGKRVWRNAGSRHSGAQASPRARNPQTQACESHADVGVHRFRAWPCGRSRNDNETLVSSSDQLFCMGGDQSEKPALYVSLPEAQFY